MSNVLGRTNWAAPRVWFAPACDDLETARGIVDALPQGSVVAVNGPVVAEACRGRDVVRLFDLGFGYEGAMNASHAADLVASELMRAMALAGSASVGLLTMPVRQSLWGGQMEGALQALEGARQDGVVRHLGLRVAGPWALVEPVWRRHDAFEFVVCDGETVGAVGPMARERRVGVVSTSPSESAYAHIGEAGSLAEAGANA